MSTRMYRWVAGLALVVAMSALAQAGTATEIRLAVASNFAPAARAIADLYARQGGHQVTISSGSTGKLYAQIVQGAPFDMLLAADEETPARLENEGKVAAGGRFTYALGQLALWSSDAQAIHGDGLALLRAAAFNRLAIANPRIAPYGRAALQFLQSTGLADQLQAKLLIAENITQAYQYVATGNAALGLVAYAQIAGTGGGSYWLPPADSYAPLVQQAVVLRPAAQRDEVRDFARFLQSATVREYLGQHYGYRFP